MSKRLDIIRRSLVGLSIAVLSALPLKVAAEDDWPTQLRSILLQSPSWPVCRPSAGYIPLIESISCVAILDSKTAHAALEYLATAPIDAFQASQSSYPTINEDMSRQVHAAVDKTADAVIRVEANPIKTNIQAHNNSPVTLDKCIEIHEVEHPTWDVYASWSAIARPLTAIKLTIESQNAFGETLHTETLTPTGTYPARAEAVDAWTVGDLNMPPLVNVAKVRCSIVGAVYQDGSVWTSAESKPSRKKMP